MINTLSKLILLLISTIFLGIILIIIIKKMNISKKIIKESYLVLFLCIFGEIFAGVILSDLEKFILILPGVLVLIPIVSGTRGSIMGIFCSRLTSSLHLGSIAPNFFRGGFFRNRPLTENILGILFLTTSIAIFSGIIAHYISIIFGFESAGLLKFIFIVLVASFLSDITLILSGIIISFVVFKKGLDPDNLLFPLNTTISDFISCFFLVLAVRIIA